MPSQFTYPNLDWRLLPLIHQNLKRAAFILSILATSFQVASGQSYPFNSDLENNDGPCNIILGVADCRTAYAYLPAVSFSPAPSEESFLATNSWMTDLPDSRLLKHMSIPGTHDSGASGRNGTAGIHVPLCHTQIWTVGEQLAAGIRFFDIRVDERDDGGWEVNHGSCDLFTSFETVMSQMNGFLQAHPDESVLMSFQPNNDDGPNFWDVYASYAAIYPNLLLAKSPPSGEPTSPALDNPNPSLGEVRGRILAISKNVDDHYGFLNMDDQNTFEGVDIGEKLQLVLEQLNLAEQNPNDEWIVNFASASDPGGEFLIPEDYAFAINPVLYHEANIRGYGTNLGTILLDFPGEGLIYRIIKTNFPCQSNYYKGCDLKLEVQCPGGLGGNSDSDVTFKFYNGHDFLGEVTRDFSFCQDFTLEDVEIRPGSRQFVTHVLVDAPGDAPLGITDDVRFESIRVKIIDGAEPIVYIWENEDTWCFSTDPDCGGRYGRFEIGNPNMIRTSQSGAINNSYLGQQLTNTPSVSACSNFQFDVSPLPPPEAVCQDITISLENGTATLTASDVDGGSTPGNGATTLTRIIPPIFTTLTCENIGLNVVPLVVQNEFFMKDACVANVTVAAEPVANCRDITLSLDGATSITVTANQIDAGSSGGCLPPIIAPSLNPPVTYDCDDLGVNQQTLTVINFAAQESSCQATVTVVESVPPIAVCQDITIQLGQNGTASITASQLDGGSSDECSGITLSASKTQFNCSNVGPNAVTLMVTDDYGNASNCQATVTVEDNVPPIAGCQDITVSLDATGSIVVVATDIDDNSSDNCTPVLLSGGANFSCSDLGSNVVELIVSDDYSNMSTCNSTVTVEDNIPPTAQCEDVTVQLDVDGQGILTAADLDNSSFDNCTIAGISIPMIDQSYSCEDVGSRLVELTVIDQSSNSSNCFGQVTVEDNIPPQAICQDIERYLTFDCNLSISADELDNGSNDACGIQNLSADITVFSTDDVGDNPLVLTVTDNNGNTSECNAVLTILRRPTTLTNLGSFSGQYSDFPEWSAQLMDDLSGQPIAGKLISFNVGTISLSALTDDSGIAKVTQRLNDDMPPDALGNSYQIATAFADDDPCWTGSTDTDQFIVLQEDAAVAYTGKNFGSTDKANSNQAELLLSATICDADILEGTPGDIANATVTFVDRDNGDTPVSPALPVVYLPGDTTKGTVAFAWTADIGNVDEATFNIGVQVGNYYLRDNTVDDQVITVSRAGTGHITGGGFIQIQVPGGSLPSDVGSNQNFGYNAHFVGGQSKLKGQFNTIIRRTETDGLHEYQIKATRIASLGVDYDNNFAEICGPAELFDVTNEDAPILIADGIFIAKTIDLASSGIDTDSISIAFYSAEGELIYSSKWSGTMSSMQELEGGNTTIHGDNDQALTQLMSDPLANENEYPEFIESEVTVFPNPFVQTVTISFISPVTGNGTFHLMDISGKVIYTEKLRDLSIGQTVQYEYRGGQNLPGGVYLYRMDFGDKQLTGRLVRGR